MIYDNILDAKTVNDILTIEFIIMFILGSYICYLIIPDYLRYRKENSENDKEYIRNEINKGK